MTRKLEEINGASSGKCSSIGANTSWKEEPTDFSYIYPSAKLKIKTSDWLANHGLGTNC
jgi:hypothetical protein